MGHQGKLVKIFASLMEEMWNSEQIVVPKPFKELIGTINEQFAGYDQHDSVEYVNFLIDALHEEVNLRK